MSYHNPIIINWDLSVHRLQQVDVDCVKIGVSWDKVAESDIELYKCLVYEQMYGLDLDCDIIFCSEENCREETHRNSINEICNNITSILLKGPIPSKKQVR